MRLELSVLRGNLKIPVRYLCWWILLHDVGNTVEYGSILAQSFLSWVLHIGPYDLNLIKYDLRVDTLGCG